MGLLQYQIVIRMYKWTRIESSWTKTQLHWKDPDRVEQWNLSSGYTQGGILSVEKALGIWAALGSEHTAVQRYVWEMCFSKVHFWTCVSSKCIFQKFDGAVSAKIKIGLRSETAPGVNPVAAILTLFLSQSDDKYHASGNQWGKWKMYEFVQTVILC